MRSSLIILLFFVAGVLAGTSGLLPDMIAQTGLSTWALYLLMLLVGISIGADSRVLDAIRSHGYRLLLIPLITITGTFAGVLPLAWLLNDYGLVEVLAVGAGFGYYSLSSIIIGELHSEALGVVALLANIMREIITLLLAPAMVAWFGKLAPVVSGGATSMDTTLPIITTSSGKEFAIVALFHGMVLTILVPILVTFILSLG
jgi:uncharacterized membrane protein YbjE (DUF340 family)